MARALLIAHALHEDGALADFTRDRYAGWETPEGQAMLTNMSLEDLHAHVTASNLQPEPTSGRQEMLENTVARYIQTTP